MRVRRRTTTVLLGAACATLAACRGGGTDPVGPAADSDPRFEKPVIDAHFSRTGGVVASTLEEDGKSVKHGVQVHAGESGRIRIVESWDRGVLAQRWALWPNGEVFRHQKTGGRHNYGYEVVRDPQGREVAAGFVRFGWRWDGVFLVVKETRGGKTAVLREYRRGKPVGERPFPADGIDAVQWAWELEGDWPKKEDFVTDRAP